MASDPLLLPPRASSIPPMFISGALCLSVLLATAGCATVSRPVSCLAARTIVVYDDETIPGHRGVWKPEGIEVEGYTYATVFVEHEQHAFSEEPLEVGVGFAPWRDGRAGARSFYDFETEREPGDSELRPRESPLEWISGSGRIGWHGHPHDIASFGIRVPVLGPYMWVYPLNNHSEPRRFTIVVYLTP